MGGLKRQNRCPECGGTKFIRNYERAELVCATCGLVVFDRIIDTGPDWRAFDEEQRERKSRTGAPMTYTIHDKGLSTAIDWRNRDSYGNELTPKRRAQIYRLRSWQRRISVFNANGRNLVFALSELDRMASQLGLPRKIKEAAAVIYRKAAEKGLIRGRSIESVVAAVLYIACRECKVPRTLNEIAEVSHVSRKEIGRSFRLILKELSISYHPSSLMDYLSRFASELGLSEAVRLKASELLKEVEDRRLALGKGPNSVVAAVIYLSGMLCGEQHKQKDIAKVAKISQVTLRNRCRELCEKLGLHGNRGCMGETFIYPFPHNKDRWSG